MKVEVINFNNEKSGDVNLPKELFTVIPVQSVMHRIVEWQRSKSRAGTHKTKGISEISGTTRKPFKQKGTGNARQGSLRSPQFRGGAVIFGPTVRSHAYSLTKKFRKLALKMALTHKYNDNQLLIFKDFDLASFKTKELSKRINDMNIKNALFIDGDIVNNNFKLASSNIIGIDVLPAAGINVLDILKKEKLILTLSALSLLENRLKNAE